MAKIDCNITKNYLKEKARATKCCSIDCNLCIIGSRNNGTGYTCTKFERELPEEAINIIQRWSDRNLRKTMLKDFKEKYPDAPLDNGWRPAMCPYDLGYEKYDGDCKESNCLDCWSRPIKEN